MEKLNPYLEQRVADQVGEIERMSRLRRFLPPNAEMKSQDGTTTAILGKRRHVRQIYRQTTRRRAFVAYVKRLCKQAQQTLCAA
jgi:hypothetical protein